MNCWHCQTDLIWGGDDDVEEGLEYVMVTNLHCPECRSDVYVYLPANKEECKTKSDI